MCQSLGCFVVKARGAPPSQVQKHRLDATPIKRGVTLEEYLAFEREATEKHILWDGEIFAMWAMAGGSPAHSAIATNAVIALGNALRGTPCRPYNSDLKVQIPRKGGAVYPDASVICGGFRLRAGTTDVVTNPSVIVEVLSPGTESFDRGDKFAGYRSIEAFGTS